jgi:hypothetical protein
MKLPCVAGSSSYIAVPADACRTFYRTCARPKTARIQQEQHQRQRQHYSTGHNSRPLSEAPFHWTSQPEQQQLPLHGQRPQIAYSTSILSPSSAKIPSRGQQQQQPSRLLRYRNCSYNATQSRSRSNTVGMSSTGTWTGDGVRKTFFDFWKDKGHTIGTHETMITLQHRSAGDRARDILFSVPKYSLFHIARHLAWLPLSSMMLIYAWYSTFWPCCPSR